MSTPGNSSNDRAARQRIPADDLTTSTIVIDETTILAVAGILDLLTAAAFQDAVDSALDTRPAALIIDMSDVEFLASAGMAVLVNASRRATDIPFAVVANGRATSRPIQLTGLDTVFELCGSREDALRICKDRLANP
ncbi:STAS domain-containing protein [Antrihabitans stalactiti]|uniref:STAS domain-containing protein n=1 Tax=Antrihabitans stalactiti TaxID=2584121 RepID=UPI0030B83A92